MPNEYNPFDHVEPGATRRLRVLKVGDIVVSTITVVETPERILLIEKRFNDDITPDGGTYPWQELERREDIANTFLEEQQAFLDSILGEFANDPRPIFHDSYWGGEIQIRSRLS
jgi:hypothetical protein